MRRPTAISGPKPTIRKSTDLFKLQDDLAHEIVAAFKTTMNADLPEFQSQAPPTKDPEAYTLYLQGNALVNRNSDSSAGAMRSRCLDKAIARDPKFAAAYLSQGQRTRAAWHAAWPTSSVMRGGSRA